MRLHGKSGIIWICLPICFFYHNEKFTDAIMNDSIQDYMHSPNSEWIIVPGFFRHIGNRHDYVRYLSPLKFPQRIESLFLDVQ